MSNPFSLKKEIKKSPFNRATLIRCKDAGKGTLKRFLLDDNLSKVLNVNKEYLPEIGFIIDNKSLYLVDLTKVDKDKFGLKSEEVNKLNKTKFDVSVKEEVYSFYTFSNKKLYDFMGEELELVTDKDNIFSIYLEDLTDTELKDGTIEFLKEMGIDHIFRVRYETSFNLEGQPKNVYDDFRAKLNRPTHTDFGWKTNTIIAQYDPFDDFVQEPEVKKAKIK